MKQLQLEEQQYKIDKQGKLAIAAPHEYKKLRDKGKLISFDELTLPQRQEAKALAKVMDAFMAKITEIQRVAKELKGQNKLVDPPK